MRTQAGSTTPSARAGVSIASRSALHRASAAAYVGAASAVAFTVVTLVATITPDGQHFEHAGDYWYTGIGMLPAMAAPLVLVQALHSLQGGSRRAPGANRRVAHDHWTGGVHGNGRLRPRHLAGDVTRADLRPRDARDLHRTHVLRRGVVASRPATALAARPVGRRMDHRRTVRPRCHAAAAGRRLRADRHPCFSTCRPG